MVANSTRGKSKNAGGEIDLEAEVSRLRQEMSTILDHLSASAESGASEIAAKAEKAAAIGLKNGKEISSQLQQQLAELDSNMSRVVRDNPLPAIGVAAGIGFLAAMLLRR